MVEHKSRFLLVSNPEASEPYILHRNFPACLIKAKQISPLVLTIEEMYQVPEEDSILDYIFLEDAKSFYKKHFLNLKSEDRALECNSSTL